MQTGAKPTLPSRSSSEQSSVVCGRDRILAEEPSWLPVPGCQFPEDSLGPWRTKNLARCPHLRQRGCNHRPMGLCSWVQSPFRALSKYNGSSIDLLFSCLNILSGPKNRVLRYYSNFHYTRLPTRGYNFFSSSHLNGAGCRH